MLYIILLAAGESKRFGKESKIFADLGGFPLFFHSLKTFSKLKGEKNIILVIRKEDKSKIEKILKNENVLTKVKLVIGGKTRQESVFKAFLACHSLEKGNLVDKDFFIIHNCANPLVTENEIKNCLQATKKTGVAALGNKVVDTIKKIDVKGNVETLSRQNVYAMQTPQIIRTDIFEASYNLAKKTKFEGTDDIALVENLIKVDKKFKDLKIKIIPAKKENFKITYKEDLGLAEKIIKGDQWSVVGGQCQKIGIGEDAHLFEKIPPLRPARQSHSGGKGARGILNLAGIKFKKYPKFKANSDGDVMIHSLCNAISSALGGKSLGSFADNMCLENGITDSKEFLKPLLKKLEEQNLEIQSLSFSLECKIPKIDPISDKLKSSLAKILKISTTQIGITATSGNDTSVFAEGKGIRATCIVLISKKFKEKREK